MNQYYFFLDFMLNEFLSVGKEAILKAGAILLKYKDLRDYEVKSDMTPVSIADKESEKIIVSTIREKFSDHSFYGEEDSINRKVNEYTWSIDPIDGTKYFLKGIPLFGIQLALFKDSVPILGLVYMPIQDKLYSAAKGMGAFLNDSRISVSKIESLKEAYITYGGLLTWHNSNRFDKFMEVQYEAYFSAGFRDTYGYNLVSEGMFDAMLENKTNIWDFAASAVIIEEAGGKVTDNNGQPIKFDTKCVIASNGKIHEELVQILKD